MLTDWSEQFPYEEEKALFEALQFAKNTPLVKDHWPILKRMYKRCEQALLAPELSQQNVRLVNLMTALILRLDTANSEQIESPYPTRATLRYMKRRARRFLRKLSQQNPPLYFEITSRLLKNQTGKIALDFKYQWVLADILLGNSQRCEQQGHGQGKYIFEYKKYHLHHREERYPEIWNAHIQFVSGLLHLDLPWEILEFAVKILEEQHLNFPDLKEEVLLRFFKSPSAHLKRVACQLAYQTFTFQGLKPEIYAGMWLYASHNVRLKIEEIDHLRPKQNRAWYEQFARNLSLFVFQELEQGNNARRVVRNLAFLQKKYPQTLNQKDWLPMATSLFGSSSKVLQELAFQGAKEAPAEQALDWLCALDAAQEKVHIPTYDRLAAIFLKKLQGKRIYVSDLEPFVLQDSWLICDFGWRLNRQITQDHALIQLWNRLSQYSTRRGVREIHFVNAITSLAGGEAFARTHNSYSYYLNYFPEEALKLIFEKGVDRIQRVVIRAFEKEFKNQALGYLRKLASLPNDLREKILTETLPHLQGSRVFRYHWPLRYFLEDMERNEDRWQLEAFFKIVQQVSIDSRAASNLLAEAMNQGNLRKRLLAFFNELPSAKRDLFLREIINHCEYLYAYASDMPSSMREETIHKLSLENLLEITLKATEEPWQILKAEVYTQLMKKSEKTGFWKQILERILNSENDLLNQRLVGDDQFSELFQKQQDTSVLEITAPPFENLLLGWVQQNSRLFPMDSAELFQLCVHKLPQLRQWGLKQANTLGVSIVFGLRLLESDLPEAVEVGKKAFQEIPLHTEKELEAALALCDSPNLDTRAFGMEFLGKRKENFKENSRILEFLSEHPDAYVQDFVAQEIQVAQIEETFVARFDREVLRMQNRSRSAKEKIKQRLSQNLQVETETLLEMARASNQRDREWAIEQLTKKALAGEEIEGFVLE